MKLYKKFSIPLVILVISLSVLLNYFFIKAEEVRLRSYIEKFGISLAKNLASNSELGVFTGNESYLEKPIKAIAEEKDVVFAIILDVDPSEEEIDNTWNVKEKGKVLAHSDPNEVGKIYDDIYSNEAIGSDELVIFQYDYESTGEEILDIATPIFKEVKEKPKEENFELLLEEGSEELLFDEPPDDKEVKIELVKKGIARVGISLNPLHESISSMKKKMFVISISMAVLLLLVLMSLFRYIAKPILRLAEAAKKIAAGNYAQKVSIKSKDEIGTLAASFNYMSDNLKQSIKRLELTSDFNQSLILANNLKELLDTILEEILDAQKIKDGAIILFDEKRQSFDVRGTKGFHSYHRKLADNEGFLDWFVKNKDVPDIEDYLEKFALEFDEEYRQMQHIGVKMIIPLHTKDEVIGLFSFGSKINGRKFSESNIKFLANLTQGAVIAIDNIILREKEAENEILRYELDFAKRVQRSLLPEANPNIEGFDIYTLCIPAKDIGGDYYDFIKLNEGNIGISIADVSGKGVPAALYMASTRSLLRSVASEHESSCKTLTKINELLYEVCGASTFVTMFYAVIDSESKKLTYTNAGHNFPLHYKDDGKICSYLINTGLPLGVVSTQDYSSNCVELKPGELILFYTDGIVEAMNEKRELFGFDRLEELVKKYGHLSAKEFVDMTMKELKEFVSEIPFHDDLTLVAMKMTN
jgi:serine phosphatase RsbU (regulator of sigma subunit)/HAMP domain-containing protein